MSPEIVDQIISRKLREVVQAITEISPYSSLSCNFKLLFLRKVIVHCNQPIALGMALNGPKSEQIGL